MIYLDNAATTKAFEEVLDTYLRVDRSVYYSPNSLHKAGLQANQLLQQAKIQINAMINSKTSYDVVFTSGATESDSLALKGITYRRFDATEEMITSVLEYPSVLEVVRYLETREGFKIKHVDVKKDDNTNLEHFKELMSDRVGLIACMYVDSVTRQIQPILQMAKVIKDYPKTHLHIDAVQAFGRISMDLNSTDSISLSGHEFNGLKGRGVLFVNHIQNVKPTVHGGGQEYGVRSGAVSLPDDITMIKAMKIANESFEALNVFAAELNNDVRQFLSKHHGVYISSSTSGSPFVLNISFPGVGGEVLVNAFSEYDIMMFTASARSPKHSKLGEVLAAMGLSDKSIEGSIRLSFGTTTTKEDIARFKETFIIIYEEIKELLK